MKHPEDYTYYVCIPSLIHPDTGVMYDQSIAEGWSSEQVTSYLSKLSADELESIMVEGDSIDLDDAGVSIEQYDLYGTDWLDWLKTGI